ncbi:unnamed protein product [Mytilus coruscus]|uniref:Kazal-like domain-containing protein n=1 Tax=Mytilus coruscus TaxID=42192 RepID=A0A6J8E2Q4_MYTCO|nr:unnamed protein product [Mytilus coruscus]
MMLNLIINDKNNVYNSYLSDINIKIVPEHVYLDSRDVNISCEFNSNLVKSPQWMTIRRNGLFLLHDVVIATGNSTELGEFFRGSEYRSRMEINGSVADQRVNVMLKTMDCEDEGHYECIVGGMNDQGSLEMFTDSYALVVNSHSARPNIKVNGSSVLNKTSIGVKTDEQVHIECDAYVGKPPIPMYWYRYDANNGSYIIERNMIGKPSQRLLMGDLCNYYTTFPLQFIASLSTPEVRLRCAVGNEQEDVKTNGIQRVCTESMLDEEFGSTDTLLFGRTPAFFNNGMPCDVINGFNCDRFSVDTDERICDTNGILYHNFCAFDQAVCKDSTVVIDSSFSCLLSPATATVKPPTTTSKTTTMSTTKMSTTAQILMPGTTDLPTTTKKTTLPTTQLSTITSNLTSGNLMTTTQIQSKTSTKKIQSTTMTHLSTTMKTNSTTQKPYSTTPKSQPTTPQPNLTTSKPQPTSPQPNSTTPEPRSTTALPSVASGSSTPRPTRSQLEQVFCDNKNIIACHYDPNKVCGTDGVTYDNNCEFAKVQCDNIYLQIKNAGDCMVSVIYVVSATVGFEDLCREIILLDCSQLTVDTDETVCDSNGNSYINFCAFDQARCKDKSIQIDAEFGCLTATNKMSSTTYVAMTTKKAIPTITTQKQTTTNTTPMPTTTPKPTTTTPYPTRDQLGQLFCDNKGIVTCSYDPIQVCASNGVTHKNK